MGNSDSLAWTSLALAVGVATIAALLGLRLLRERKARGGGLAEIDRKHFLYQDLRRVLGIILMAVLALGIYAGSRMPIFVVESRGGDLGVSADIAAGAVVQSALETHANRMFVALWMGVFCTTVLLLGLALVDWVATRRYAMRHRQAMNQARLELLRDTLGHANTFRDGLANGRGASLPDIDGLETS